MKAPKKNNYAWPRARHDSNNQPTVVIDSMGLAYAAMHTYSGLTYKGSSTAMIYGIPQMVKSIINIHKPSKLIMVWDGSRDARRLEILPEYKGHRDAKRDVKAHAKFHKQIRKVRNIFYRLGIPQAYSPYIEGDDMVYKVVKKEQMLNRVIIITGDKDFGQMINKDVKLWNNRTKLPRSHHTFRLDHNCEVNQFVDYLCLLGDHSDDIPGINGIGPARARKFLDTFGSIDAYLKSKAEFPGLIDKENLKKVWTRNRTLIDLEYFDKHYNDLKPITWFKDKKNPTFNLTRAKNLFIKYNLRTCLDPKFLAIFENL